MNYFIYIGNYTLAVAMWLVIGRMLLSLFVRDGNNFMLRFFCRFTDPLYRITGTLLPFARARGTGAYTILLLFLLRILFIAVFNPVSAP